MNDFDYIAYELGKAQGDDIRMKVETDDGDSRWICITRAQFEAVKAALAEGSK